MKTDFAVPRDKCADCPELKALADRDWPSASQYIEAIEKLCFQCKEKANGNI